MNFAALLQEVAARLVAIREECDAVDREIMLADLEADIVGWLEEVRRAA